MTIHIALLRGINVGGNNKIKMADLRQSLKQIGLNNVRTYIQSGNVLFESGEDEAALRQEIEQLIERRFGLAIKVILRTDAELRHIVANLPFTEAEIAEAGASAEGECLHVSMLSDKPAAERVEKLNAFDFADETYRIAGRDVYLLFGKSVRNSKLAIQVEKLGVPTTTRNWRTINKLVAMADEMAGADEGSKR